MKIGTVFIDYFKTGICFLTTFNIVLIMFIPNYFKKEKIIIQNDYLYMV